MCTKVNNSSPELYNMAVEFASKKSAEKTRTIDSEEMKQLTNLASKDGISKEEQEFIDSLKDQNNVEKIAAVGKLTEIEPNSMNFNVSVIKGKVEIKGLNQNSETKQRIFDSLSEKGINPEEITYTIKYLDSTNADFSQVETLIKNQFAKAEKYGTVYNKVTELKKELENTTDPAKKTELSVELKKFETALKNWEEKLTDIVNDYHPHGRSLLLADGLKAHK